MLKAGTGDDLQKLPANVLFRLCEYLSASGSATLCTVCTELNTEISSQPIWKNWCTITMKKHPFLGALPSSVVREFRGKFKDLYSCLANIRSPFMCRNVLTVETAFHQTSRDDPSQGIQNVCKTPPGQSFWSSTGNFENDESFPQSLTFLLGRGRTLHLLHEVKVKPYCALYQRGWPYYGGRKLVVEVGYTPYEFHSRFEFEWEESSDLESFEFPHGVVGVALRVTFMQPYQIQDTDNSLYFAIDQVMAFGTPVCLFEGMGALHPLYVEIGQKLASYAREIGFDSEKIYPVRRPLQGTARKEPIPIQTPLPDPMESQPWKDQPIILSHKFWLQIKSELTSTSNELLQNAIDRSEGSVLRPAIAKHLEARREWNRLESWIGYLVSESKQLNSEETMLVVNYPGVFRSRHALTVTPSAKAARLFYQNDYLDNAAQLFFRCGMVQKALEIYMDEGKIKAYVRCLDRSVAIVDHREVIQEIIAKHDRAAALSYCAILFTARNVFSFHPITAAILTETLGIDFPPNADIRTIFMTVRAEAERERNPSHVSMFGRAI